MSYDSVADTYEKVAVPWFTPLATDLLDAVALRPGDKVLDLGTGTGLVGARALVAVGSGGFVFGLDPSTAMLQRARRSSSMTLVAGEAPGVPFADGAFDVVVANLVLSHLPDLEAGLADVLRAMGDGGRLGCTAWAAPVDSGPDNELPEANQMVESIKAECGLAIPPPPVDAVPYEERLQNRVELTSVLTASGLSDVDVAGHRYRRALTVHEFLSGWGSRGRYLRHTVGEDAWQRFTSRAADALGDRFGDAIACAHDAWVALGRR